MKKLFYIISIVIVAYYGFSFFVKNSSVEQGGQAPNFEAELIDGSSFKLSDLKGSYVLLDFWGSWCRPCRIANPNLAILHNKFPNKLTIVTIALEKSENAWKRAAQKDGFIWKHQIVEQSSFVMMSEIARKYGLSEIPSKFLITPEGKLMKELSFDEIDKILSQ